MSSRLRHTLVTQYGTFWNRSDAIKATETLVTIYHLNYEAQWSRRHRIHS